MTKPPASQSPREAVFNPQEGLLNFNGEAWIQLSAFEALRRDHAYGLEKNREMVKTLTTANARIAELKDTPGGKRLFACMTAVTKANERIAELEAELSAYLKWIRVMGFYKFEDFAKFLDERKARIAELETMNKNGAYRIFSQHLRIERLEALLRWLNDGIDHFGEDADREQVVYLQTAIAEALKPSGEGET